MLSHFLRCLLGSGDLNPSLREDSCPGSEGSVLDFALFYQAITPSECKVKN